MPDVSNAIFGSWSILFEPTFALVLTAVLYLVGWLKLRRLAPHRFDGWRLTSFLGGLLALFIVVGLGALGFIDDYIKVHKRRSLGLNKRWKITGQAVLAVVFALLAHHYTQASTQVSFVRPLGIALGPLFVVWVFAVIAASSNRRISS